MTTEDQLWATEEQLWLNGFDSAHSEISEDAVIIFPYPAPIQRGTIGAQGTAGWRTVRMSDRHFNLRGDIAILAYRVSAERPNAPIYNALCASTYIDDAGVWKLVSHQQTPAGEEASVQTEL
ncbi:hypothetical protein [Ruegeria atlantica]|uniref:DUF4440 domain-containing protein n=1 Tax=Ruegeria atlantica TaxID=81569 RepID=A0A0P1EM47_9RHOB|nr:hypothetical protein [Ruegeria atlantica]CUH41942.1 hypothetical protein RUM4293_00826 [Ruegeria atlantica]